MFIKEKIVKDKKSKKSYKYCTLVETVQTEKGPRQRVILHLGKLDLPKDERKSLGKLLEYRISGKENIFKFPKLEPFVERFYEKYKQKIATEEQKLKDEQDTDYQTVDLKSATFTDPRSYGMEFVVSAFWEKLKLNNILSGLYFSPKEISLAKAVIFARLISPGSELHTFKWLQKRSSLLELLKFDLSEAGKDAYYEISDLIYQYKDEIEEEIRKRLVKNYSLKDTIYLYDLTNTYFEGTMSKSQSAKFGRSKDKRYDCRLITLALVVDNAGFPAYSKVYGGNQSEPETLPEILKKVISKNNKAVKKDYSIIMDRGIATQKNIDFLKGSGYSYFVVERRDVTKDYKQEFSQKDELFSKYQTSDKKDVYLKKMEEKNFDRVLVYSEGKAKKEDSIIGKKEQRFIEDANRLIKSNKKGNIKVQAKINIRIGRLKERYGAIAGIYSFKLIPVKENSKKISEIQLIKNNDKKPKKREFAGCYVIETDRKGYTAKEIWDIYMQLNRVESAFRSMKSELGTRPIYHQLDSRISSHLFISVIAYAILHSIRYELKDYNINHSWNELKDILSTHQRATIKLKAKSNSVNYIRVSSEPNDEQSEIYNCLDIKFKPNRKIKKVKFSL